MPPTRIISGVQTPTPSDWTDLFFDDSYLTNELLQIPARITEREAVFIAQALALKPHTDILDLACGHGRHLKALNDVGYHSLTGLERSHKFITLAREKLAPAIKLIETDLRKIVFYERFDAIYSFNNSLFYWDDRTHKNILGRLFEALRPGGQLLIDSLNYDLISLGTSLWRTKIGKVVKFVRFHNKKVVSRVSRKPFIHDEVTLDRTNGSLLLKRKIHTNGREFERSVIHFRLYTASELYSLLSNAGFTVQTFYGSVQADLYTAFSPRMITVARKPYVSQVSSHP